MSSVYDNWERLVEAVLKREELIQIALCESSSPSISTDFSSRFSFASSNKDVFAVAEDDEEKSIQEVLSLPILLADRAIKSAQEAESFRPENAELAHQVTELAQLLGAAAGLIATSAGGYDRPFRRMSVEVTKTLDRALALARKCRRKRSNVLHLVLSITTAANFKKVSALLDSSLADIRWVLSVFNTGSDFVILSLPPIATNDPVLAWVWIYIAAVHMGRAEAAHELAILAGDSERNKKIIVEEKGVPPLLEMLKESGNVDAQSAAARALCSLADDQGCVRMIKESLGVEVVTKALLKAPMSVQIVLADLVSIMSEMDAFAQEEFGRENVMGPLVSLLGIDVDLKRFKGSVPPFVMINKEMMKSGLKTSCANALWKLARGSLSNSRKISETNALLILAEIINNEVGELKMNCLMVVMELAAAAESNADLRRAAFEPSSTAAKVILDQLLRVINENTSAPFVIPAIKAIGCLASTFPAKEKQIIGSLVTRLSHRNPNVATEAAKALVKFVCDENYNRKEHSQAIIEFKGAEALTGLLISNRRGLLHLHGLVLLCNLAINAGVSKAFDQTGALSVLEGTARHAVNQNPDLRELLARAVHHLTTYQAGVHTDR